MVDNNGDHIFVVTENQIQWRGSDLITEERISEIINSSVEQRIREMALI